MRHRSKIILVNPESWGSECRMRFLPVFLDLQTGPILLVGAGELARAKLRLLAAAGARIRWYATDGNHEAGGLRPADAARIEFAEGDPLAADLSGVIAILCAGAGDIGTAMSARAKAVGLPVNVMDDLSHSTFIFPAIVDRGDVVVAVGTGGASPVVAPRRRSLGCRSQRSDCDPVCGRGLHWDGDVGAGKGGRPAGQCDG